MLQQLLWYAACWLEHACTYPIVEQSIEGKLEAQKGVQPLPAPLQVNRGMLPQADRIYISQGRKGNCSFHLR